ncbi:PAAR domain-containing protein [Paraburkholderia sp. BL10I2N1]|uniref:PAAR domain-containing protein n=1 Tax=Paraburkholderia sp. BL10I2N1 TaxID=1938796 RepID=UPI00105CDB81|nr:PAAR domain-containing protein [Paraburkholderia sp. BL10I2N1]TDN61605.1 PAAR motif-containing protein [Paraburkholderia sp. BL10I2N1]
MRKAAVRDGDPTTTGGFVIGTSTRINDKGKKVALIDDYATCGNCKGTYRIFGTGKGMSDMGRVVVVDGDSVLCPCGKNRVIVGSNPGCFLNSDHGSASASSTASAAQSAIAADKLEHYFEITDALTGAPIEGMTYKLFSKGVALVGDKALVAGKTMAFSKNEHPDLTFIAWRPGDVR